MRDSVDLKCAYSGDLIIEDGDLADTSLNTSETYYQILRDLLASKPGENLIYPLLGIDFSPFTGRINSASLGRDMAKIIKTKISETTYLYGNEFNIEPFPIGENTIAFKIGFGSSQNSFVTAFNSRDNWIKTVVPDSISVETTINTIMPPTVNSREG